MAGFNRALDAFRRSLAGVFVAAHVMGGGAGGSVAAVEQLRVSDSGRVFCSDVWQLLGASCPCDRTPLALTPELVAAINAGDDGTNVSAEGKNGADEAKDGDGEAKAAGGGDPMQAFTELCCDAFNVLRANCDSVLIRMMGMVQCGLDPMVAEMFPDRLCMEANDKEATAHFKLVVKSAVAVGSSLPPLKQEEADPVQTVAVRQQLSTESFGQPKRWMWEDGVVGGAAAAGCLAPRLAAPLRMSLRGGSD